jgi:N-acetylmuramoyl-L-alanine amidase
LNKLVYILVFVLFVLTFIFSYKVKDYKIDSSKNSFHSLKIVSNPITFNAERKFLTALYREKHTGDCDHRRDGIEYCLTIDPKLIVVHMTDIKTFKESMEYMKKPVLEKRRINLLERSEDELNVSAHFLINTDGTIYSLMPEKYMARHAIGVNHLSIGIENVGMNKTGPTKAQVTSNIKLVKHLMEKYKIPKENVISHYEVGVLRAKNSKLFKEKEEDYFQNKNCGIKIMEKIKKKI